MRIEKRDSEKIRAIGFLCALMVVAIHCTSIPKDWWNGTLDMPKWIIALQALGSDTVARLAVPWFFVISGFFLVKNLDIPECTEFAERVREIFLWWKKFFGTSSIIFSRWRRGSMGLTWCIALLN